MRSKTRVPKDPATGSMEPSRAQVVLFHVLAVVLALIVGVAAKLLDVSRVTFLLAGVILVLVYVPVGLILLFGRSEPPARA